jgi:hypothetical protein
MLCAGAQSCVDLTSDQKNCGACGHDCLGGACTDSQCQPVLLAQYFGNSLNMYVGAQAVYVITDAGYVGRASKDGSDLKPLARPGFASSALAGTRMAEDGDRFFFVRILATIQLSYCLTTGCDATATPVGGQYTRFFAVDQADHRTFWVDYSPSRLVSASTIGAVSGEDVPRGTLEPGTSGSYLFYSQGGIYWADGGGIYRLPVSGGVIAPVTSGTTSLAILATNSTSLFVNDNGAVGSVPLPSGDGKSPTQLIAAGLDAGDYGRLAADDRSIYWVSKGVANTCQISSCLGTRKTFPQSAAESIRDVGVDDGAVYLLVDTGDVNITHIAIVRKIAK